MWERAEAKPVVDRWAGEVVEMAAVSGKTQSRMGREWWYESAYPAKRVWKCRWRSQGRRRVL